MEDRYDKVYIWGNQTFVLEIPHLEVDDCRRLLMKVLTQAVGDYLHYVNRSATIHTEDFLTASGIIFDPDHRIQWGDSALSLSDICEIVSVEPDWFQQRVIRRELKD